MKTSNPTGETSRGPFAIPKILVPLDFSDDSKKALPYAFPLMRPAHVPARARANALLSTLVALFLLSALSPVPQAAAQVQRAWVNRSSLHPSKTNQPAAILLAADGGVIVAGSSRSPFDEYDDLDYLLIKYHPNGSEAWQHRYNSLDRIHDQARAAILDPYGNLLVTGSSDTIKVSPTGELLWHTPTVGRDVTADNNFVYVAGFFEDDLSVCKLDATDGANVWSQTFDGGGHGHDLAEKVAIDSMGNVFVAGDETFRCDPRAGCTHRVAVLKYDQFGALLWQGAAGIQTIAEKWATARALFVGTNNNAYLYMSEHFDGASMCISFSSSGSTDWRYLVGEDTLVGSATLGTDDCSFVASRKVNGAVLGFDTLSRTTKISKSGEMIWSADYHGPVNGLNQGIAVQSGPNGTCYVVGNSTNSATGMDIFVIKYDQDGQQVWVDRYDGPTHGNDAAIGLVVDNAGNAYITGYSPTTAGGTEFVTIKYSEPPKIEKQPSGAMRLQFVTTPNAAYTLQATTNFFDWNNLLTNTADATGLVQFDDTEAPAIPLRVYRTKATE